MSFCGGLSAFRRAVCFAFAIPFFCARHLYLCDLLLYDGVKILFFLLLHKHTRLRRSVRTQMHHDTSPTILLNGMPCAITFIARALLEGTRISITRPFATYGLSTGK